MDKIDSDKHSYLFSHRINYVRKKVLRYRPLVQPTSSGQKLAKVTRKYFNFLEKKLNFEFISDFTPNKTSYKTWMQYKQSLNRLHVFQSGTIWPKDIWPTEYGKRLLN